MNARQTYLFLMAQAELVRVEGMKALNEYREMRGESQAYNEEAFIVSATNIEKIATDLIDSE